MRSYLCLIAFLLCSPAISAQSMMSLSDMEPSEGYENIYVRELGSEKESSAFLIWVKKAVKLHIHEFHSEQVYVISGRGKMIVGKEERVIKKGDLILIPKGTPHSVAVLSRRPLKVLSVQAPEFTGKDRVLINR